MPVTIQQLWKEITEHPDYLGGTVFCTDDLEGTSIDPEDVDRSKIEERTTEAGWDCI